MRRRAVFWAALLVVGGLDLARSLHVRLLRPRPAAAEPRAAAAPAPGEGQAVYAQHCARCHGTAGDGNGPVAAMLHPRPRDFTNGVFKLKSTPVGEPASIEDLRGVIVRGMPGSAMPSFGDILSAPQIDAVIETIRRFGPHAAWGAAASVRAPAEDGNAEHGAKLFSDLGCPACHGKEGRGDGMAAGALKDVWKQATPPRDLTAPWTFRAGSSRDAVYQRLVHGMSGTPMPGYQEVGNPRDLADVVAYINSIARAAPWVAGGAPDNTAQDAGKRGEYLVRTGTCGMCHSAGGSELAGGVEIDAQGHGVYFASNLTSDAGTGMGNRKLEELAYATQTGHTRHGRLNYLAMPWIIYGAFADSDALAIATYLKSLPPVTNAIPRPLHYGFIETVLRKLTYSWPAALPDRVSYHFENAGAKQHAWGGAALQDAVVWIQIIVLVLGILSLFRVPVAAADAGSRSSAVLVAALICLVVFGTAALVVYWYPALTALPAKPLVDAFAAAVPTIAEEGHTPEALTRLRRGRYLYLTSSCAYCHNGNGSGGGKVTAAGIGTVWAANLTSDATGLAERSDDSILRAVISGVAGDGRAIDPRVMPWDRTSNLTAEDQHALLAYLRSLPPIRNRVPQADPSGAETAGVTFWIGRAGR